MSSKRYTDEFKIEAVKQVTERGHGIYSVASRLGITHVSLYKWIQRYSKQPARLLRLATRKPRSIGSKQNCNGSRKNETS